MKQLVTLLSIVVVIAFFIGCQKNELSSINAASAYNEDDAIAVNLTSLILPESDNYDAIPQDPKNPLSANKVALGKLLFFETRLSCSSKSVEGLHTYSCATCHHSEAGFQSGEAQAIGEGGIGFGIAGETRFASPSYDSSLIDVLALRTPTVLNSAYQEVTTWSGQFGATGVNSGTEYAWNSSAVRTNNFLGYQGLETTSMAAEKTHRLIPDTLWLASDTTYSNLFDLAFPEVDESQRISTITVSLAIAAYERTLLANQAPFQRWLKGDKAAITTDQKKGAQLFFGKAKCSYCHSGPALNSMNFFALGMSDLTNGVNGAFNIIDNAPDNKGRGNFTQMDSDMYKFKVPQLYNLKGIRFLGHGASFGSVTDVVKYMNAGIAQNSNVPKTQLSKVFRPLHLTDPEVAQIVNFVENALYDPNLPRYDATAVPSGNCIPNNDTQSRIDRGCQ